MQALHGQQLNYQRHLIFQLRLGPYKWWSSGITIRYYHLIQHVQVFSYYHTCWEEVGANDRVGIN